MLGQTQLSLLLWPGGGVLLHLLVGSGSTWPAQPGRLVGSGSRLASFLPALPERGACPGPLPYRSFLHFPVVQGAGFEFVESCGLCFFWLPYLLVLPCCCCISPAGLFHALGGSHRRKLQYNMNCATPGDGTSLTPSQVQPWQLLGRIMHFTPPGATMATMAPPRCARCAS